MRTRSSRFKFILFFMFLFSLSASFCLVHAQEEKSQEEKKKEEKTPVITEEILVVGEAPKDRPLLSLKRLSFDEKDGKVCYRYGESSKEVERMEYLKFIARVVSHIPTRIRSLSATLPSTPTLTGARCASRGNLVISF